jgi:hypothetical protein
MRTMGTVRSFAFAAAALLGLAACGSGSQEPPAAVDASPPALSDAVEEGEEEGATQD